MVQIGLGSFELTMLYFIFLVIFIGVGLWVYFDAKKTNTKLAWQWATGIVILFHFGIVPGILLLAIYSVYKRD